MLALLLLAIASLYTTLHCWSKIRSFCSLNCHSRSSVPSSTLFINHIHTDATEDLKQDVSQLDPHFGALGSIGFIRLRSNPPTPRREREVMSEIIFWTGSIRKSCFCTQYSLQNVAFHAAGRSFCNFIGSLFLAPLVGVQWCSGSMRDFSTVNCRCACHAITVSPFINYQIYPRSILCNVYIYTHFRVQRN